MSFPWILGRGFFLHGSVLEDGVTLESPLDLDLVLLQCAEGSTRASRTLSTGRYAGHANKEVADNSGMTTTDEDVASTDVTAALLVDSARGHIIKVSTLLLDAGADKDVADSCCHTALTVASNAGHARIGSLLQEAGA